MPEYVMHDIDPEQPKDRLERFLVRLAQLMRGASVVPPHPRAN